MDRLATLLITMVWVTGWVLAKGFWSTLLAVIFSPWGWYLIVKRLITLYL